MKKIGISIFTAPEAGGAYQYTRSLLKAASGIQSESAGKARPEYDFKVYSMYPLWEDICKKMGLQFELLKDSKFKKALYHMGYIFNKAGRYNSSMYRFHPMWEAYDRDGLDLMIITSPTWYGKPEGKHVVIPIFDLMHRYIDFEEVGGGRVYEERDRRYESICACADGILTDSKLGVMQVVDSYGDKIDGLVSKTFDLPFVVPDYVNEDAQGEKINVPDKYILYPAQFWKHKNHVRLIEAAGELKYQNIYVNLVFTGTDKNAAADINAAIEKYDLKDQITNLGYITDDQLVYLYRHARALMFPSFAGPTNIPPLEAMTLGCPVAVSDNFAMPEQIGRAGLVFAPDSTVEITDCMRRLWLDDKLCDTLKRNGLEQSKVWTIHEFTDRFREIIGEIYDSANNNHQSQY